MHDFFFSQHQCDSCSCEQSIDTVVGYWFLTLCKPLRLSAGVNHHGQNQSNCNTRTRITRSNCNDKLQSQYQRHLIMVKTINGSVKWHHSTEKKQQRTQTRLKKSSKCVVDFWPKPKSVWHWQNLIDRSSCSFIKKNNVDILYANIQTSFSILVNACMIFCVRAT